MSEVLALKQQEIAPSQPRTTMDMVQEAVMRGASIEVLEKLMGLHERWEAAQARRAFDAAIAAAKAEIPVIEKNRHVGFKSKDPSKGKTDYWHEDLAEIARTVDPILGKYGLSYRFRSKQEGSQIHIACIVSHKDGHFEENSLASGADTTGNKNSHQAIASATTYLSRYTLRLALGLAAGKDDDGAKADGEPEKINETQCAELLELADEVEANKAAFCNWAGVESFPDILAKDFDKAKKALEAKRGSTMLRARGTDAN